MPDKNVIFLCIDRLRAAACGAYGNTWYETPALDRLAGESFVFDQALVDSPHLQTLYRSLWNGRHAAQVDSTSGDDQGLITALRASGWMTALVTDEPQVAALPQAESFEDCQLISLEDGGDADGHQPSCTVADRIGQTQIALLFAEVASWIEASTGGRVDTGETSEPFLLWVHARGMAGLWDAPLELRNALVEADDPDPPQHANPPLEMLDKDHDPDELHGFACAYAGQVMVFDSCLGALLDLLGERSLLDNTLVVLVGLRGFPLGEHGRLGDVDSALYGELVHVPWLVRMPDGAGAMCRTQALVQPPDFFATLREWAGLDAHRPSHLAQSLLPLVRGESSSLRDHVAIVDGECQQAVRSPAWYLRQVDEETPGDDTGVGELFIKPDDRWEQNEVASRCQDVVDGLSDALEQFQRSATTSPPIEPPPLDERLCEGPD